MEIQEHTADLIAAFGSFKFLPMPIVFSTNNLNPKLLLFNDHIEYRGGFITRKVSYDEIENIDVFFWQKRTNNLIVSKKHGYATFIGNFKNREQLKEFLQIFQSKGCELTDKAKFEISGF